MNLIDLFKPNLGLMEYIVCFVSASGKLAVSHYCNEDDKEFWEKEGYVVIYSIS